MAGCISPLTTGFPILFLSLTRLCFRSADTGLRERVIEKEVPVPAPVPAAPQETHYESHIPDRSEERAFTNNPPAPVNVSTVEPR